jgi:hypothetical protein
LTRILPVPVVRLVGSFGPVGVNITRLTVRAPRGTSVIVRCRGRGCPRPGKSQRAGRGTLRFATFERGLRPGAVLEVWVLDRARIGKYTRFRINGGTPPTRIDRCLRPRSTRPVGCPR